MPRLNGFRFSREINSQVVWAYHRFGLSTADVGDLLAERGVVVSRVAIRLRGNRFAASIGRNRPRPADKWHMDEGEGGPENTPVACFRPRRYRLSDLSYRHARAEAFDLWNGYAVEISA